MRYGKRFSSPEHGPSPGLNIRGSETFPLSRHSDPVTSIPPRRIPAHRYRLVLLLLLTVALASPVQSHSPGTASSLDSSIMGGADDPYMMPYYTGKILPTPRDVIYRNEYISLADTAVILNGIDRNDPRLHYLIDRITRYGGHSEFVEQANAHHTCVITINDDTLDAPQNPQGYRIRSSGNVVSLKGTDFQGLLWAISSLNQMIFLENGEPVVRSVDVTDWPESLRRGFLAGYDISRDPAVIAHFMVAYKLNLVDFRGEIAGDQEHYDNWRLPRTETYYERVQEIGQRLTPLGFEWYAGGRFLGHGRVPQINCSSDADLDLIYTNFALPVAEAGGNLSVQFDDHRYPLHPDDEATFGTAANADHSFLTRLYAALRRDYPDIRIAFCPPYYWGPVSPNPYPESRDEYLTLIGTLPEAIDIYWTGPSVRSTTVLPEHVSWETDRIRRAPLVFQNGVGTPHALDSHYVTDPIYSLSEWYYEGYLGDIRAYMVNGGDLDRTGVLVSVADWTWNPDTYDPEATIEDAVLKLTGPEAYPILLEINAGLSTFDPYLPDLTIEAIRNASTLHEALDHLETLNAELNGLDNGGSIEFWTQIYGAHIRRVERYVAQARQASEDPIVQRIIGRDDASITMYFAVKDGAFDPDSDDILVEPDRFSGGGMTTYGYYDPDAGILLEDRPTAYVCGAGTPISEMSATFEVNRTAPSDDYLLILSGADDYLPEKCPIRITLNGTVIFEGPNPFSNTEWNIQTAQLPAEMFESTNVLTISNISPTGNFDAPPVFLLNYVVIAPEDKEDPRRAPRAPRGRVHGSNRRNQR